MKSKGPSKVGIVLALFNGAQYLDEFLSGLVEQTFESWELYIRDDQSTDETVKVVHSYAVHDERFRVIHDEQGNLGPKMNFETILSRCLEDGCDHIFFADQDDVWERDKIYTMLNCMVELEGNKKGERAILLHSDLRVVDDKLKTIHPSFMRFQNLDPLRAMSSRNLLMQNICTGCAMVLNRSMAEKCLPFGRSNLQHDWWISLVASVSGETHYMDRALVNYRQHAGNKVGARGYMSTYNPFTAKLMDNFYSLRRKMLQTVCQADEVFSRFSDNENADQKNLQSVNEYRKILRKGRFGRVFDLMRMKIHPNGLWRSIVLFTILFSLDRRNAP